MESLSVFEILWFFVINKVSKFLKILRLNLIFDLVIVMFDYMMVFVVIYLVNKLVSDVWFIFGNGRVISFCYSIYGLVF